MAFRLDQRCVTGQPGKHRAPAAITELREVLPALTEAQAEKVHITVE